MQKTLNEEQHFPTLKRISQISIVHCGPAVLRMLMSFQGVRIYQRDIVSRLGISDRIKSHGMNVYELASAVNLLAPDLQFWYKDHATVSDISILINEYEIPVGVEWRGEFLEDYDGDDGHYSIVTGIDISKNKITIADPYPSFSDYDREFSIDVFVPMWWDTNEIINTETGVAEIVEDKHLLFIITQKGETFPHELGLKTL